VKIWQHRAVDRVGREIREERAQPLDGELVREPGVGGVRPQTPRLALPPLSPERVPKTRPSGARAREPADSGAGSASSSGAREVVVGEGAMASEAPSKCRVAGTRAASTSAGQ
jgi:hypothetical protein